MVRALLALMLALMLALAAPAATQAPPKAAPPPKGAVTGMFLLPDRPVWAGEMFELKFAWQVDWDLFRYLDGELVWMPDPLVTEGWTRDPQAPPASVGGRTIAALAFSTHAMALQPGSIRLKPARQQMQIVTGGYETGGITIAELGAVAAQSAAATLKVRPLPPPPADFGGAVGSFTLRSTLDRTDGEVGKPLVWTVTLAGAGNWTGFGGVPARPLPRDFDIVGPPRQSEDKGASLFARSVTERITIVPRKAGAFALGPVELRVFDPAAGDYRIVTAPPVTLQVKPGAAAAQPPAYEAEPDPTPPGEALPPPISGVGHAWAPLTRGAWRTGLALPFALVGLLWIGLAVHRARRADPDRLTRRAHARLVRTIAALATATDARERRRLVRAWQRDTGQRLKIRHEAPSADAFEAAELASLWDEAERHLYGRNVPLPGDWPARAGHVLAAQGAPPRFDPRTIFAARNLYPVAALLCALLVAHPIALPAAGPPARSAAMAPGDWIARYTVARNDAAARHWEAAAAQAGIAWVQRPRSAETTALWARAAREGGFGGRAGGGLLLPDERLGRWSGLLAPLGWQVAALAGLALAGCGAAGLLMRRFGHAPRGVRWPARLAAIAGLAVAAAGIVGVDGYGPAAAADAAIVRRQVPLRDLPIDTPDAEAKTLLAPGTAGHMDRAFFGWMRLTLADGRSGWVRRGDVVSLWR